MTSRIEDLYLQAKQRPSDINEHLSRLRDLGAGCRHITELGVRRGVSTTAWAVALPARLICYDLCRYPEVADVEIAARAAGVDVVFHEQDVLAVTLEPTDLLFIDTLHTYDQLRQELALHADRSRKYIVLHDTETFGQVGEAPGTLGLWPAVTEFLDAHPEWIIHERYTHNNGLTILARKPPLRQPASSKRLALVTCLYDLVKRGSADHRTVDWVIDHAAFVLDQDRELVIFTDPELEDRLRARRAGRRTKIVPVPFEKLLRPDRATAPFRGEIQHNANRSKVTPTYVQLMWSKYAMLEEALDVTDASHLGWIDLGITHVAKLPEDRTGSGPDDVFADPSDLPRVHVLRTFSKADVDAPDYWRGVRGHLAGGLVVGRLDRMRALARAFWAAVDRAIGLGLSPLDEGLLSYVVAQRPWDYAYSYGDYEDIVRNHDQERGGDSHRRWIADDARSRGLPARMEANYGSGVPMIYCVSLARSVGRRDRMLARLAAEGLRHEVVEACDGDDAVVRDRLGRDPSSPDEPCKVACLISHLRALQAFLATPATEAIVCEDDVRLRRDFARHLLALRENVPDDAPIVSLGYLVWQWDGFLWAGRDHTKENLTTMGPDLWGTQMYLVRRSWAAECVARFGVMHDAIATSQVRTAELIVREGASRGGLVAYPPLAIEDLSESTITPGPTNHHEVVGGWDSASYGA